MTAYRSYRSTPAFAKGGLEYDPETDTFDVGTIPWRCFHCNQIFTSRKAARLHFGETPEATPECQQ